MKELMPENYTVIDIETTGLDRQGDDIIELSGLKVRNNNIVEEFSSLINPDRNLDYYISNLTGITDAMLQDAPSIKEVLPEFVNFISNDTIIGHNVNFDIKFVHNNLKKHFNSELNNKSMDTMILAKQVLKLQNYKLTTIAQNYNIDTKNNHRGLKDCYITYEVYNNLKSELQKDDEPGFMQQSLL